jgi:hypothetical protein
MKHPNAPRGFANDLRFANDLEMSEKPCVA